MARISPGDGDRRHGTANGYISLGCRCGSCREAYRAYTRARRRGLPPGDPRHGTAYGYGTLGCRCDLCREAKSDEARTYAQARPRGLASDDQRHGTTHGYRLGCRCELCREATNARRLRAAPAGPDDQRHGTLNGYTNLGCRCDLCREAMRRYHGAKIHWRLAPDHYACGHSRQLMVSSADLAAVTCGGCLRTLAAKNVREATCDQTRPGIPSP